MGAWSNSPPMPTVSCGSWKWIGGPGGSLVEGTDGWLVAEKQDTLVQ